VVVERIFGSSESVMHQEETDEDHLKFISEFTPQRYPLTKEKLLHGSYSVPNSNTWCKGETKTRAAALSSYDGKL
jgi:hypothetical protein